MWAAIYRQRSKRQNVHTDIESPTEGIWVVYTQGRIQDFPLGGGGGGGRQPPTQVLFGENICKNERIWSCWGGGGAPETFVCRSATDTDEIYRNLCRYKGTSFCSHTVN